ncbi:MAG: AAA ATPase midasin [Sporothrix thermara]
MAVYDVAPQRQSLLADTTTLALLPPELLRAIQSHSPSAASTTTTSTSTSILTTPALQNHASASFLDAIAQAALLPRLTGPLFAHFEPLFADICARWLLHSPRRTQDDAILAAFARVLPLAPYLSVLLDKYLAETAAAGKNGAESAAPFLQTLASLYGRYNDTSFPLSHSPSTSPSPVPVSPSQPSDADTVRILLVLWRLVNFDAAAYAPLVPAGLQTYFRHDCPTVRFLAIRIFCLVHAAADFKLESVLREYTGESDNLVADFDGVEADYTFLTLYEHTRCKDLHERVLAVRATAAEARKGDEAGAENSDESKDKQVDSHASLVLPLTPLVSAWGRSVIPRPAADTALDGTSTPTQPSSLIKTATTLRNLEALATCLQKSEPVLLRGLPGSGKTSLVREAARELGMEDGLVTLHLNEQTDAKTLIGLYSAGTKPGSFQWRPGILTVAVQEGRWVLIEDLDRAPNEVMSTILPLIERRELLVPSRRETIKASRNFRIFATVRTTLGLNGQETTRSLLGERLWQQLSVQSLPAPELRQIVYDSFPALHALASDILAVFDQLTSLSSKKNVSISPAAIERPMTLRDLMKWCRRLEHSFFRPSGSSGKANNTANGNGTATPTLSETDMIGIFLDAVDCFAGSVKDARVRKFVGQTIAQALRIAPDVAEHVLLSHEPPFKDTEKQLVVGRATLKKPRRVGSGPNGLLKPKPRPFATTAHARRLLEQISVAVDMQEPLLLVGETGIGKTTVVQQLAESMGHKLVVVNLSQQSEVGDLLGGFKPVNARSLAMPLKEEFEDLFSATGISTEKNEKYLKRISSSIARGRWADVCRLWQQAPKMFDKMLEQLVARRQAAREAEEAAAAAAASNEEAPAETQQPTKRRKTESSKLKALLDLKPRWALFSEKLDQFDMQVASGTGAFAFAFVEGKIVQAVRNGDWLLLDEINLASPDTLESIADLLSSGPGDRPSILLSETGEIDKIEAHADFRVFGAMNPATDVGKRDLPIGLRSRFTELYVASPDREIQDLVPIIKTYLKGNAKVSDRIIERVARLYLAIKALAEEKRLVDGANEVPHYSLRTLTRVLRYVDDVAPLYGLERALVEGFCMGFLTLLSQASENLVMPLILDHLLGGENGTNASSAHRRQAILAQAPRTPPSDGHQYVRFVSKDKDRQYWLMQGAETPVAREDYIRTAYVERNLLNLVRATSTRRFPVLIQGPTSAGKTSMIEYLAQFSGNKFVRINNHEHTDLQEYLGTYVSGADGKLRFQEGVLVQAMRQGHWIVLDELNLAPTDVLEALNRLLDDNRELLVPETQEVVRPHPSFMLFATQNPAGLYGGRKVLSRAFRNRFLELHFDDIPEDELGHILQMRCRNTAPSDCERIVAVYKELSRLRQTSRVFEQKNSFATLRDLFRWALREADTREQIACHGFMLLAERVRDEEERMAVKGVIETVFKTKIDVDALYGPTASADLRRFEAEETSSGQVVWTKAMRRLFVLVTQALKNREPILLVGETGCGKTTICQMVAEAAGRELHIVNAHQNTETGDLIGSQRPVRNRSAITESLRGDVAQALALLSEGGAVSLEKENDNGDNDDNTVVETLLTRYKAHSPEDRQRLVPAALAERIARDEARSKALFEWTDGSLVHAMKTGSFFLLDEISLADDSVLERLNSVLEPQRTLLLAEKGVGGGGSSGSSGGDRGEGEGPDTDDDDDATVTAQMDFQFLATMNPGGDFGKKELSPALRNRFTEIWVPPLTDSADVEAIVAATLREDVRRLAPVIVAFSYWFGRTFRASSATPFSIRDILVWAQFVNKCSSESTSASALESSVSAESATLAPEAALIHGAATVFIDTLGANPSAMVSADATIAGEQREQCLRKLGELLGLDEDHIASVYRATPVLRATEDRLWAGSFSIPRASASGLDDDNGGFEFAAPTTRTNLMRVVRALQMGHKPVLLEGNPGVGKTTLVSALARACGRPLTRINLSDQTDLMDLFGTDVPVEGAEAGNFAWRDAPFLQAMQRGEWVLLDEMNLASQTVLEGLNACLDHRGEVYIAELDQTFKRHADFRLFAAQNPHHQGGGRKGLPSSFVNRFIVVYADVFSEADQLQIAHKRFPSIPAETVRRITAFVAALEHAVTARRAFGLQGAPWEFNLRDTLRWLELAAAPHASADVADYLDMTVRQRFRTARDRDEVTKLFASASASAAAAAADGSAHTPHSRFHSVSASSAQAGFALVTRNLVAQPTPAFPGLRVAPRLPELESLLVCVQHNLPCILVGASGTGKSALLQHVAALAGKPLVVFPLSADVDAMDLVGGFEQADPVREVLASVADLWSSLEQFLLENATIGDVAATTAAAELVRAIRQRPRSSAQGVGAGAGGEAAYFACIADRITRLAPLIDAQSPLAAVLEHAHDRLQQPLTLENPRFEWLDSIIVQAAQQGHWLVLDNANLCNASVLDRLNSLLERPHGFLSINEHSGPDGEPRVVALHPDFRVFLTVDPRYGELSRAMRNRSIEIFLEGEGEGEGGSDKESAKELRAEPYMQHITPVEARMHRFLEVTQHLTAAETTLPLWLDNLTLGDSTLLARFLKAVEAGSLVQLGDDTPSSSPSSSHMPSPRSRLHALLSFVQAADAQPIREAILQQYSQFAAARFGSEENGDDNNDNNDNKQLAQLLVHEQPLHPLQNVPVARLAAAGVPWRLAVSYERYADAVFAHEDLDAQAQRAAMYLSKISLLTRLQRSALVEQVAMVKRDSTAHAFHFLREVAVLARQLCFALASAADNSNDSNNNNNNNNNSSLHDRHDRYLLNIVWHLWWRTHMLTSQASFDEAQFQAHLGYGRRLLEDGSTTLRAATDDDKIASSLFHAFVAAVARHLEDDFAAGFKLTTGLSMDVLWPALRPLPIPDAASYRQITSMERLASRFDNLKWRVASATPADLGKVITSLAEAYRLLRLDGTDSAGLVRALADEIARLEALVGNDHHHHHHQHQHSGALPLFVDIFEALRQLHVLYGNRSTTTVAITATSPDDQLQTLVLSNLSTSPLLRLRSATSAAAVQLQTVDCLLSHDASGVIRPWSGTLSRELLRRCDTIASTSTLASLRSLESELPFVSKVAAQASTAMVADPVAELNVKLADLLRAVLQPHDEALQQSIAQLSATAATHPRLRHVAITKAGLVLSVRSSENDSGSKHHTLPAQDVIWPELAASLEADAGWPEHLGRHLAAILHENLLPAVVALAASNAYDAVHPRHQAFAAVAWVQYALGSIRLYTPDKVFDPYLKRQTEQAFDDSLRASLVQKADALRQFDLEFSNEDATAATNLRLQLVDEDLAALDATRQRALQERSRLQQQETASIYRPPSTGTASELSKLQKDVFNPVLDVTIKDSLGAAHYRLVASLLFSENAKGATTSPAEALQELQLIQGNISRLIERLLVSFTAYQDLAVPLANFLRCLQLGLSLSERAPSLSTTTSATAKAQWLTVAPFLGGRLTRIEDVSPAIAKTWELLQFGSVCAAVDGGGVQQQGASAFSAAGRRRVFETFHHFYEEWKKKLLADQRAEQERTSLYRFRGSQEDEEEADAAEFMELFPTYDEAGGGDAKTGDNRQDQDKKPSTAAKSTWDLSADIAKIHQDILQPSRPATDVIIDFCKSTARKVAREDADDTDELLLRAATAASDDSDSVISSTTRDGLMFPATMLVLDEKLRDLHTASVTATASTSTKKNAQNAKNNKNNKNAAVPQYNFYADTNLPEARKLVALVHDIQVKFRSLQRIDEIGHLQPLADVLDGCDKVLELGFHEPLAKVIPRVEKLHEFLYEWQFRGYAPRVYLAPSLYERTTATLVSWRKLELSTWSRLFDTEADKCRQDAGAWWFIAYEAAVAGPMAILLQSDSSATSNASGADLLAYHAEQLVKELASYLASSIAGQYAARLDLLRQIATHLRLLTLEHPALAIIANAVQGLIAYYARFEPLAADAIRRGRESLQKKMNDVLLLASWRDTNIDALRESARKSHQKLFRLVRKFRAVLGQPMGPAIQQGLPDGGENNDEAAVQGSGVLALYSYDKAPDFAPAHAAAQICQQLVPGWGSDAHTRRLSSMDRLVGVMAKASAVPDAALDAADIVAGFLTDLLANASALRKETPPLLTDENKTEVKQLKTRKTRLFDETVKAVRQMGFSSNLGTSRLAAQSSLARILATYNAARLPGEFDLPGLEYALHKFVDLAPQVRSALHDHNSDLQHTVARRSVGYLEGILYVALQQRGLLATATQGLVALDEQIAFVRGLGGDSAADALADSNGSVLLDHSVASDNAAARGLRWLVTILRVAVHLVSIHGRLASTNDTLKPVQTSLEMWTAKLNKQLAVLDAAPALPAGFVSAKTAALRSEIQVSLVQFLQDLDGHIASHPELTYVLWQVRLWVRTTGGQQDKLLDDGLVKHEGNNGNNAPNSLLAFTDEALILSKKVLDAVQKFNKAVAELPTSIEETAWLVNSSTKLSAAVKSLHADTVTSSIAQCIELLRPVFRSDANSANASAATALFRVLLPLLEQYASTYRHTLLQLATVHRSTCQLGHRLSRAFVEIAAQGFCTPPEKTADEDKSNDTSGKLEEGTGLGEGEGAEDISKDIQPDEDLSELAQTANKDKDKDKDDEGIEDEKDAVDMGNDEMEGEMGSAAGDDDEEDDKDGDDKDDEDEEDDMDEEAGDVDDLDPTAVDEKMWDGEDDANDTDKEQQGNEAAGQQNEDEMTAATEEEDKSQKKPADEQAAAGDEAKPEQDNKEEDGKEGDEGDDKNGEEGGDDDDEGEIGSDDEEAGPQQELNRQDQNVEQNDVLDLPDDMQMEDEDGKDGDDDDFDNLDDLDTKDEEGGDDDEEQQQDEKRGKEDDEDAAIDEGKEDDENEDAMMEEGPEVLEDNKDELDEDEEADEVDGEGAKEEGVDEDEDAMDVDGEEEKEEPLKNAKPEQDKNSQPAPTDVQSGLGQEQDTATGAEELDEQQDASRQNDSSAKREQGDKGQQDADDQEMATGGEGMLSNRERDNDDDAQQQQQQQQQEADAADQEERQPFKKLGDVLERWHKTRQEIKQAEEKTAEQESKDEDSANQAAQQEFQHLHDEEAAPTTQAMGAAEDEEAKPFDDAMAIEEDEEEQQQPQRTAAEGEEEEDRKHAGNDETNEDDQAAEQKQDNADDDEAMDEDDGAKKTEREDGRAGASMQKGAYDREEEEEEEEEDEQMAGMDEKDDEDDDDEEVDKEVATQLLSTHLDDDVFDDDDASLVSMDEAMRQWSAFQTATHALSLALAAQLRLILTPSQATRLSGGFRTGKRLSIRKIIPYIASGYKRDKIWMRRSVPTKRAYQILLCVDDSKSMGENGGSGVGGLASSPGHLALSSLVMVGRALSMLEAGQVGVLGFGARVFTAHALDADQSFGSGASGSSSGGAAQTLRRFTFQQDRTDVALLLRSTIDRFKHAREMNAASSASADLWQLALVLSDGLTPSAAHERIRQLLREAAEARIMVVFVILDGSGGGGSSQYSNQNDKNGPATRKKTGDSVLDLKEAKFIKDPATGTSRIVIERYLDTFPFPYYLIVHHLDDLPAALAGLLRTWFAEVNA